MLPSNPYCDLHIHVGASVAPHIMWSIAHQQGFKLPVNNYWEFVDLITAKPGKVKSLDEYLAILHEWTEKIQSSPAALERAVYEIIGKEYRSSRVEKIELRFNPMKRNQEGKRDLDHIIHAALRGMDRVILEYQVEAGLILCLAREFPVEVNEIILEKAIKYRDRGVVGIDLAGTETNAIELTDSVTKYAALFQTARDAGLGTTVHTGETTATSGEGVIAVMKHLKPDRIGHGVRAAYNEDATKMLADTGTVLEICPTSNLNTRAVRHLEEFKYILGTFQDAGVLFTINTDGTYLCETNIQREYSLMTDSGILDHEAAERARMLAFEASFIP
ncbi:MAG: adenosine deaminase [Proteobacteria bacterium]|nr:adenosine deaminase [Pseudomonadota bacterium]MCP4920249.1 adenosine deaminase [Pseudomonadota bacterium]